MCQMNSKKWLVVVIELVLIVIGDLSKVDKDDQSQGIASFLTNQSKKPGEQVIESGDGQNRILVINVHGVINSSEFSQGYSHELTLHAIEQLEKDPTIKAVLLSLDTPGGGVYETREAYDWFKEVKEKVDVPVYASMGSVAASGGVYYAMLADEIYATPETMTGSIGVIASLTNIEGLYNKLGLKEKVYKSGEFKDMNSATRPSTKEEDQLMDTMMKESFDGFKQVVMEGRDMTESQVREIADGRVFTAKQAVENKLIDGILYEREVIEKMKEDLNLSNPEIFQYQSPSSGWLSFLPFSEFKSSLASFGKSELEKTVDEMEKLSKTKIEYRWEGY